MWPRILFPIILLLLSRGLSAHDGLEIAPPVSVPEAWNVLMHCQANIEKLVIENQLKEIPTQMVLSIQAIRLLQKNASQGAQGNSPEGSLAALAAGADRLGRDSSGLIAEATIHSAISYGALLRKTAGLYPAEVVHAPVFSCPMCKGIRELNPKTVCPKCGMKLVARTIPATAVVEPSIAITPTSECILVKGEQCKVSLRFVWKRGGRPVDSEELMVVHTERIHLLIIDESLEDYHHEHPRPTGIPGEYALTFTPRRAGSYRIFADVTPLESGLQEYPVCDLAGSDHGSGLASRSEVVIGYDAGLKYELTWLTDGRPVYANQPVHAVVKISDAEGVPFRGLEPIMGAYAHLVGFYEDRKTVVHIHPLGDEPKQAADRGGPSFMFRFAVPKAGHIRLYCQVQIGGVSRFIPFAINIAK